MKYDIHASNIKDINIETHPQINFWIGFLSSADRRKTPTDLEHMSSKEFYRFYNVYTKQVIMSCNTDPCKVTITIEVNLGPDSGSASITSFVFSVNTDKFSTTTVKVARTTTRKSRPRYSLVTELSIKRMERPDTDTGGERADMSISLNLEEDSDMTSVIDEEDFLDLGEATAYDTQGGERLAQDAQCAKTHSHTTTDV